MSHAAIRNALLSGLLVVGLALSALAQEEMPTQEHFEKTIGKPHYSPYAGREYPTRVLWGDTHLHTAISVDAGATGCKLGPEEAYRFARGEEVTTSTGLRAKLSRPLDFLVVSDHSEMFALMPQLLKGDPDILTTEVGRRWFKGLRKGGDSAFNTAWEIIKTLDDEKAPIESPQAIRSAWQTFTAIADKFNEPGKFTAFIGYEWTSMPNGNNLHRVVVFRDNADKVNRTLPYSQYDSPNPEDLWRVMAAYEKETGGQVLAIPHNGNVSGGLMFADVDFVGKPLTKEYAANRSRWEPLVEATQQKGDSETHPFLSPNDEFADFGRWDKVNLNGIVAHKPEMFQYEYVRAALKRGLKFEQQLGVTPFKFGMIGSTDSHVGISAVEEDKSRAGSTPKVKYRKKSMTSSGVMLINASPAPTANSRQWATP